MYIESGAQPFLNMQFQLYGLHSFCHIDIGVSLPQ